MSGLAPDWMTLLTDAMQAATGSDRLTCAEYASAAMEHLQREYGGLEVYVPTLPREPHNIGRIESAIASGMKVGQACRRFGVSRSTYYRLKQTTMLMAESAVTEGGEQ